MNLSEDTNISFFFAVDCGSPGWSGWMPNCYCKNYILINPHFPSIRHRQFLSYYTLTSFYYYLSEFTLTYGLYLKQRNKLFCLFVFSLTYRCRIWIIIIKSCSFGTKEPGKRDHFYQTSLLKYIFFSSTIVSTVNRIKIAIPKSFATKFRFLCEKYCYLEATKHNELMEPSSVISCLREEDSF